MGLKIVLQGFGGAEPYFLEIHPGVIAGDTLKAKAAREIDLTDYIVGLLQDVEGISTTKK